MVIQDRQYTVDKFAAFAAEPENLDRLFELIHGEIVEKVPTQLHAAIVHLISGFLFVFLREHPIGWALVEARYQLPGDEHNARVPDLSFVSDRSRPLIAQGPAPYMPDFAVEIKSPDDSPRKMLDKANYYLANGTRIVWLVYPDQRMVEMLTSTDRDFYMENDMLDGGDVLPGFKLLVRDIFPG